MVIKNEKILISLSDVRLSDACTIQNASIDEAIDTGVAAGGCAGGRQAHAQVGLARVKKTESPELSLPARGGATRRRGCTACATFLFSL
ncbi:hypothetical protein KGM_202100 [Danaus plexippus plexippus]|uniref:Uncharacterized protein n=1 Tax=Danaus plexippus plexippus TaxID=278856 RepID=A0A212ERW8_DANPL|nr:hypothetical protein KGM_202100 [Danaus plexippus plexippus]